MHNVCMLIVRSCYQRHERNCHPHYNLLQGNHGKKLHSPTHILRRSSAKSLGEFTIRYYNIRLQIVQP